MTSWKKKIRLRFGSRHVAGDVSPPTAALIDDLPPPFVRSLSLRHTASLGGGREGVTAADEFGYVVVGSGGGSGDLRPDSFLLFDDHRVPTLRRTWSFRQAVTGRPTASQAANVTAGDRSYVARMATSTDPVGCTQTSGGEASPRPLKAAPHYANSCYPNAYLAPGPATAVDCSPSPNKPPFFSRLFRFSLRDKQYKTGRNVGGSPLPPSVTHVDVIRSGDHERLRTPVVAGSACSRMAVHTAAYPNAGAGVPSTTANAVAGKSDDVSRSNMAAPSRETGVINGGLVVDADDPTCPISVGDEHVGGGDARLSLKKRSHQRDSSAHPQQHLPHAPPSPLVLASNQRYREQLKQQQQQQQQQQSSQQQPLSQWPSVQSDIVSTLGDAIGSAMTSSTISQWASVPTDMTSAHAVHMPVTLAGACSSGSNANSAVSCSVHRRQYSNNVGIDKNICRESRNGYRDSPTLGRNLRVYALERQDTFPKSRDRFTKQPNNASPHIASTSAAMAVVTSPKSPSTLRFEDDCSRLPLSRQQSPALSTTCCESFRRNKPDNLQQKPDPLPAPHDNNELDNDTDDDSDVVVIRRRCMTLTPNFRIRSRSDGNCSTTNVGRPPLSTHAAQLPLHGSPLGTATLRYHNRQQNLQRQLPRTRGQLPNFHQQNNVPSAALPRIPAYNRSSEATGVSPHWRGQINRPVLSHQQNLHQDAVGADIMTKIGGLCRPSSSISASSGSNGSNNSLHKLPDDCAAEGRQRGSVSLSETNSSSLMIDPGSHPAVRSPQSHLSSKRLASVGGHWPAHDGKSHVSSAADCYATPIPGGRTDARQSNGELHSLALAGRASSDSATPNSAAGTAVPEVKTADIAKGAREKQQQQQHQQAQRRRSHQPTHASGDECGADGTRSQCSNEFMDDGLPLTTTTLTTTAATTATTTTTARATKTTTTGQAITADNMDATTADCGAPAAEALITSRRTLTAAGAPVSGPTIELEEPRATRRRFEARLPTSCRRPASVSPARRYVSPPAGGDAAAIACWRFDELRARAAAIAAGDATTVDFLAAASGIARRRSALPADAAATGGVTGPSGAGRRPLSYTAGVPPPPPPTSSQLLAAPSLIQPIQRAATDLAGWSGHHTDSWCGSEPNTAGVADVLFRRRRRTLMDQPAARKCVTAGEDANSAPPPGCGKARDRGGHARPDSGPQDATTAGLRKPKSAGDSSSDKGGNSNDNSSVNNNNNSNSISNNNREAAKWQSSGRSAASPLLSSRSPATSPTSPDDASTTHVRPPPSLLFPGPGAARLRRNGHSVPVTSISSSGAVAFAGGRRQRPTPAATNAVTAAAMTVATRQALGSAGADYQAGAAVGHMLAAGLSTDSGHGMASRSAPVTPNGRVHSAAAQARRLALAADTVAAASAAAATGVTGVATRAAGSDGSATVGDEDLAGDVRWPCSGSGSRLSDEVDTGTFVRKKPAQPASPRMPTLQRSGTFTKEDSTTPIEELPVVESSTEAGSVGGGDDDDSSPRKSLPPCRLQQASRKSIRRPEGRRPFAEIAKATVATAVAGETSTSVGGHRAAMSSTSSLASSSSSSANSSLPSPSSPACAVHETRPAMRPLTGLRVKSDSVNDSTAGYSSVLHDTGESASVATPRSFAGLARKTRKAKQPRQVPQLKLNVVSRPAAANSATSPTTPMSTHAFERTLTDVPPAEPTMGSRRQQPTDLSPGALWPRPGAPVVKQIEGAVSSPQPAESLLDGSSSSTALASTTNASTSGEIASTGATEAVLSQITETLPSQTRLPTSGKPSSPASLQRHQQQQQPQQQLAPAPRSQPANASSSGSTPSVLQRTTAAATAGGSGNGDEPQQAPSLPGATSASRPPSKLPAPGTFVRASSLNASKRRLAHDRSRAEPLSSDGLHSNASDTQQHATSAAPVHVVTAAAITETRHTGDSAAVGTCGRLGPSPAATSGSHALSPSPTAALLRTPLTSAVKSGVKTTTSRIAAPSKIARLPHIHHHFSHHQQLQQQQQQQQNQLQQQHHHHIVSKSTSVPTSGEEEFQVDLRSQNDSPATLVSTSNGTVASNTACQDQQEPRLVSAESQLSQSLPGDEAVRRTTASPSGSPADSKKQFARQASIPPSTTTTVPIATSEAAAATALPASTAVSAATAIVAAVTKENSSVKDTPTAVGSGPCDAGARGDRDSSSVSCTTVTACPTTIHETEPLNDSSVTVSLSSAGERDAQLPTTTGAPTARLTTAHDTVASPCQTGSGRQALASGVSLGVTGPSSSGVCESGDVADVGVDVGAQASSVRSLEPDAAPASSSSSSSPLSSSQLSTPFSKAFEKSKPATPDEERRSDEANSPSPTPPGADTAGVIESPTQVVELCPAANCDSIAREEPDVSRAADVSREPPAGGDAVRSSGADELDATVQKQPVDANNSDASASRVPSGTAASELCDSLDPPDAERQSAAQLNEVVAVNGFCRECHKAAANDGLCRNCAKALKDTEDGRDVHPADASKKVDVRAEFARELERVEASWRDQVAILETTRRELEARLAEKLTPTPATPDDEALREKFAEPNDDVQTRESNARLTSLENEIESLNAALQSRIEYVEELGRTETMRRERVAALEAAQRELERRVAEKRAQLRSIEEELMVAASPPKPKANAGGGGARNAEGRVSLDRLNSLEKEVESLNVVLQMKNDEVRELMGERRENQERKERIAALQAAVEKQSARIEDLTAQLDRKNELQNKLLREKMELLELTAKKDNLISQLGRDLEEVKYRIQESTSSSNLS